MIDGHTSIIYDRWTYQHYLWSMDIPALFMRMSTFSSFRATCWQKRWTEANEARSHTWNFTSLFPVSLVMCVAVLSALVRSRQARITRAPYIGDRAHEQGQGTCCMVLIRTHNSNQLVNNCSGILCIHDIWCQNFGKALEQQGHSLMSLFIYATQVITAKIKYVGNYYIRIWQHYNIT